MHHVLYIYPHLKDFLGKCWWTFHTWSIWVGAFWNILGRVFFLCLAKKHRRLNGWNGWSNQNGTRRLAITRGLWTEQNWNSSAKNWGWTNQHGDLTSKNGDRPFIYIYIYCKNREGAYFASDPFDFAKSTICGIFGDACWTFWSNFKSHPRQKTWLLVSFRMEVLFFWEWKWKAVEENG